MRGMSSFGGSVRRSESGRWMRRWRPRVETAGDLGGFRHAVPEERGSGVSRAGGERHVGEEQTGEGGAAVGRGGVPRAVQAGGRDSAQGQPCVHHVVGPSHAGRHVVGALGEEAGVEGDGERGVEAVSRGEQGAVCGGGLGVSDGLQVHTCSFARERAGSATGPYGHRSVPSSAVRQPEVVGRGAVPRCCALDELLVRRVADGHDGARCPGRADPDAAEVRRPVPVRRTGHRTADPPVTAPGLSPGRRVRGDASSDRRPPG